MGPITLPLSVFNLLTGLATYGGVRLYMDLRGGNTPLDLSPEELVTLMKKVQAAFLDQQKRRKVMS